MSKLLLYSICNYVASTAYRGTVFAFRVSLLVNFMYFYCFRVFHREFLWPTRCHISYHRHQGLLECLTFVTNHAFSNASRSIYLFLAQWRLVLLWKCCFHKVSLLLITTLMLYHKIHELFYLWCQTNLKLQEKLCNKCPSSKSSETAVIVTFLARSLALHWTTEPEEALWQ